MGQLSFVFLDDGLDGQPDRISAAAASVIQSKDLNTSGLLCNDDKLHWEPMQVGEWLRFVINSISMKFFLPVKKGTKLKGLLEDAFSTAIVPTVS